jgi:hypothetical protein
MSANRSERVRTMILEVEDAMKTMSPAQIASQFADYQKEFPSIFAMLLKKDYRRDILAMMVDQLDKMEQGDVSQHNASVAVGTMLVDRIVKPQLKGGERKK